MSAIKRNLMSSANGSLDFGDIFSHSVEIAGLGIIEKPRLVDALAVSKITRISPVQTRGAFDPQNDPEDAEFLASIIREGGNHEPVWVVSASDSEETYQLIAGHRRIDALRAAGIETARALVWPVGTTDEQQDRLTFLENYHRKDLSTSETARVLKKMMTKYEYKLKDAAEFLSISVGHAHNLKMIAEGPKEVLALVDEGLIGASSARQLVRLDESNLALAISAIRKGKPVRDTLEEIEKGFLVPAASEAKRQRSSAGADHVGIITAGKSDRLLPLITRGEEKKLIEALDQTGVAGAFSSQDLRLMALLRLGMEDANWDYVITTFSTLLRADRRCLKTILSAVESLLTLKAYSDTARWKRQVKILEVAAEILSSERKLQHD